MKITVFLVVTALVVVVHSDTVTIPELGPVLGSTLRSAWSNRLINQYLGIKYAQSPSGARRFAPPVAVNPWTGTYNATVQGISCPQITKLPELFYNPTNADQEDCLSLNIFSPSKKPPTNKLWPVMVFFHGGAFYEGSAREFTPEYLLEQDVVLVVPQYRLGPLGFLCLHTDGVAGNMGLMDQVLALEFVNKYIKNFNGDNSKVTIFGQSAGAVSVSALLISPMVQPNLFQKAIVQSGSAYADWVIHEDPVSLGQTLYKTLTSTTADADVNVIEATFKAVPVVALLGAVAQMLQADPIKITEIGRLVVQQAGTVQFLTETPTDAIKNGHYRPVPMLAGVTKHDGSFLVKAFYDTIEPYGLQDNNDYLRNEITRQALNRAGIYDESDAIVDTLNNIYFKKLFKENRDLTFKDISAGLIDIYGMLFVKAPTFKQAKINALLTNDTYLYTFDYKGEHTRFGFGADTSKYPFDGGVHHSDDLLYLFPYPYTTALNEDDTKIAKTMSQLWTSFAIKGVPYSRFTRVKWPQLKKGKNGNYLHINDKCRIGYDFVNMEYKAATNEANRN